MSSTSVTQNDVDSVEEHATHHDGFYIKIALVLGVLTLIEIILPMALEGKGKIYGPALLILMAIKFVMVASFFMHLRFDNVMLTRVFYAGLFLAVAVYIAALSAMVFWDTSGTTVYDDPPPAVVSTTVAPA